MPAALRRNTDNEGTLLRMLPVTITKAPKHDASYDHEFYASTGEIDRYEEVIEPKAFAKTLPKYVEQNPVILFAHNHRAMPVGKTTWGRVDMKGLKVRIKWAPTQLGQETKMMYDEGFLRALSVGFLSLKSEVDQDAAPGSGKPWRIHKEVDLLEISAVPVPANAGALIQNGFEPRDIDEVRAAMVKAEGEGKDFVEFKAAVDALIADLKAASVKVEARGISFENAHGEEPYEAEDINAPWDGASVRRGISKVKSPHDRWAALEIDGVHHLLHHVVDGAVNYRACIEGIAFLNGANGQKISLAIRQVAYEHIRHHLTDDFSVSEDHIAPLVGAEPEERDVPTPEQNMLEFKNLLAGTVGEIKTLVAPIVAQQGEIVTRLAALEQRGSQPNGTAPSQPEPKTTPQGNAAAGEGEVFVLDFDPTSPEAQASIDKAVSKVLERMFGAPPA